MERIYKSRDEIIEAFFRWLDGEDCPLRSQQRKVYKLTREVEHPEAEVHMSEEDIRNRVREMRHRIP